MPSSTSTLAAIATSLDALSVDGVRWLRRTRLRASLRLHARRAIAWLVALPALAVLVSVVGWFVGQPWRIPVGWLLAISPLPTLLWLGWHLGRAWLYRPTRRQGLALFDERLELQDRLQTADEFLVRDVRTPFMDAAVLDCEPAVATARTRPLDRPREAWSEMRRLAVLPLLAGALIVIGLFVPTSSRLTATTPDEPDAPPVETTEDPPSPRELEPRSIDSGTAAVPVTKEETTERSKKTTRKSSKGRPTPPKKSSDPATRIGGREKVSLGDSEGGQTSQATSSGRSSRSRGTPGSQAPSSLPEKKKTKPKKSKTPKDSDAKDKASRKRKQVDRKSGATAGRGSSSGSSRNPASTDWASKDRTEEADHEEFEQEEDVDDEESESEARGGLQPSLRDRRPPVNRDLSIGFGNRSSPDANGRGGPGQRKKSRGVAALVLGTPVPDHVKGQPNPGRVKINQERVQPQPEETASADAEDRGRRSAPAGRISERTLDAHLRRVVREYFLQARKSAGNATTTDTTAGSTD